jgi:hypothetical protein
VEGGCVQQSWLLVGVTDGMTIAYCIWALIIFSSWFGSVGIKQGVDWFFAFAFPGLGTREWVSLWEAGNGGFTVGLATKEKRVVWGTAIEKWHTSHCLRYLTLPSPENVCPSQLNTDIQAQNLKESQVIRGGPVREDTMV